MIGNNLHTKNYTYKVMNNKELRCKFFILFLIGDKKNHENMHAQEREVIPYHFRIKVLWLKICILYRVVVKTRILDSNSFFFTLLFSSFT